MRKMTLAGLTAGALLALAPAAWGDAPSSTQTFDCNSAGTIAFTGSPVLWPPNHKYRTYNIVATSNIPSDTVSLSSMVTNDEVINGDELNGAGNTTNDVTPNPGTASGTDSARVIQQVRGERSGRGDGRTYTFNEMATFGMGAIPCSTTFTVTVPHDQRKSTRVAVKSSRVTSAQLALL